MKYVPTLLGSTFAAIGISLLSIGCGDKKEDNANSDKDKGGGGSSPPDMEAQMVGYWAPDVPAMKKQMEAEVASDPNAAAILPLIEGMIASMSVEIPEQGKMVITAMGETETTTYEVTATDAATKTLTAQVTKDGETQEGTATIDGDSLTLKKGEETMFLKRITEEEFKKRQEAAQKAPAGLPGVAPDPGSGPPTPPTPPTPPAPGGAGTAPGAGVTPGGVAPKPRIAVPTPPRPTRRLPAGITPAPAPKPPVPTPAPAPSPAGPLDSDSNEGN